jgi:DNA-binding transcriptional regulator YdaS (Cro superfamily)
MRKGLHYPDDDPRVIACKKAIRKAGGLTRVALALGVTPQAIYKWELCPPDRCAEVERLTGISIHDLRPDVFGVKPRRVAS